jgi:hypothetical protein
VSFVLFVYFVVKRSPLIAPQHISLSGSWDFRLDEEHTWRPIPVPGCWEAIGVRKDHSGPAWYRARFAVPPEWAGARLWLRFGAISYHCAISVNGRAVGEHTGMWDSFAVEITDAVAPGQQAELLLRVQKPAGLERGPASPSLPGAFPLRETLAGFLPYVWGQVFGGVWQDVALVATGRVVFGDVHVCGAPDGRVYVEAELSGAGAATLELRDPAGAVVYRSPERAAAGGPPWVVRFEPAIPDPRPWSPLHPVLYEARLLLADGDERAVRFGLRSLDVEGTTMLLNGRPLYPRMVLSWGWYPGTLHSNPAPERVRADLERLKLIGYNGVKLCLWFPPQHYFELADELGMLLWVELPMWLPQPTDFFRRQTPAEYERLARLARNHPSVLLFSLGCELNRAVGADILGPLYEQIKALVRDPLSASGTRALLRDNSGSGEVYGGLLNEHAEYYDYHFYSDLQFFRGLLDYFSPRWRPEMPWLFGEFCDCDTFRDLRRLDDRPTTNDQRPTTNDDGDKQTRRQGDADHATGDGQPTNDQDKETSRQGNKETAEPKLNTEHSTLKTSAPSSILHPPSSAWWTLDDPELNPQGARWQYEVVHHEARLRANGLWERGAELERISERQALVYRKYVLELVRTYGEIGGYVITGERDTPISTPGMWDDLDRLKHDPAEFRAFNADLVLLAGWDRRRAWVGGGDRAARWDTFSYAAGALVRPHLIASHYGASEGQARLAWAVAFDGEGPFAAGEALAPFVLAPGRPREVAVAEFFAPEVAAPRRATLRAWLQVGDEAAENAWPLWFFPRDPWGGLAGLLLADPAGRLPDLRQIASGIDTAESAKNAKEGNSKIFAPFASFAVQPKVVIATAWTDDVAAFVAGGGAAVLLQDGLGPRGPLPVTEMPFWREAIRLAEPHPAWRDFPLDDGMGMQLYGCATDYALDTSASDATPILRRLDARTMRVHDYAVEIAWGAGRAIVSSLRCEGGAGDQPLGVSRNTAAAYLLNCWVRYLHER